MPRGGLLAFLALVLTSTSVPAEKISLPRSTPESQGVSSAQIRKFVEAADQKIHTLHRFLSVPSSAWDRISAKLRFARVPDNSVIADQRSASKTSRRG